MLGPVSAAQTKQCSTAQLLRAPIAAASYWLIRRIFAGAPLHGAHNSLLQGSAAAACYPPPAQPPQASRQEDPEAEASVLYKTYLHALDLVPTLDTVH